MNINGIVSSVISTQNNKADFVIRIENKDYKAFYNGFLPLMEGDVISGAVTQNEKGILIFTIQPFVCIPTNENIIKQYFIRSLRGTGFGDVAAQRLYDKILENIKNVSYQSNSTHLNGEDSVILYLTDLASKYYKSRSKNITDILTTGTDLKETQASNLLTFWHTKRSLRRLYLIGLTKADILNCTKHIQAICSVDNKPRIQDLDEIYNQCIKNPLVLPPIHMEKATKIASMLNIQLTQDDLECGYIVRKLYNHNMMNSWTCSPMYIMLKHHPSIPLLQEKLTKEFKIIFDRNCLFLTYPYIVEMKVCEYLTKLIKKTYDRLETNPIINSPTLESANYLSKTITEEQKTAIQGALQHYVSIVTGPPGTGKSSIIKEICHNLTLREIPHMCASFTGKAVARIIEVTGETV